MDLSYDQLLQLILNRKPKEAQKLMSIPLSKCPMIEESVKQLEEDLQQMFYTFFTKQQPKQLNMRTILPFKQHKTPMPVCNRLLVINQAVYRCYDCTSHQAAVLCIRCFERGNHQGHRFTKIQSGGGNCDCGNPDAILQSGFCVDHKGKADEMIIDEQQEDFFNRYVTQIFIWALKLYQFNMKKQTQMLFTHLVDALDWLNNESLYYNTLTNKLLFRGQNPMIDHIFVLGSDGKDNPLAKKATELFLNMFSLQVFKENLSIAYLRAYNKLLKFQTTKFQSLFIQLFANNDLVQKIIQKSKISLDPRKRAYNPYNYYNSLIFMGTIKQRAAKAFFTPIIENGGIHCQFIEDIEKYCEAGTKKLEQVYSESINVENSFYTVNKVLIKLIKNDPILLQKEIRNKYQSINKYSFTKNKIVLIYQRLFAMLVFVYFKCDYSKIDMIKLRQILGISLYHMKEFLKKLTKCFLFCLKQYGKCIGNSGYGLYSFENYVDIYCRSANGNRVILLDIIGIKFCASAYENIKESQNFSRVMIDMLNEEANKESLLSVSLDDWQDEEQQQQNSNKPKSRQSAVIFYLGWLNVISMFIQNILYDRAQVVLANQLQINDNPLFINMYDNQFKKLILNVRQMSMHQIEAMGIYWFSKPIDKAVKSKYSTFDKIKKKFILKENVQGIPIKRQLLKSFTKTPDHYLRSSDQLAMDINDTIRKWRDIFFPFPFVQRLYKTLMDHLDSQLNKQLPKYIKQLANHLKIVNMFFQYNNQAIDVMIDQIIKQSSKSKDQKLINQISLLFHAEKKQNVEESYDKQKDEKRKQLLRKKKEEKLKIFKSKQNIDKFLSQNQQGLQNQKNQNETCIICHEQNTQNPLFYLGSTFLSNIVYSILGVEGINPFFLSCFHQVHQSCFLSISKEKQKIYCPLCKAMTNIILPTGQNIENQAVLATSVERMEIIFALQYKKQFENLPKQILKAFIQLFFSGTIEESLVSQRQIKLFKVLFGIVEKRFKSLSSEQRKIFLEQLMNTSNDYQKSSKQKYNIGLLIDFVFMIASKCLTDLTLTQQYMKQVITHCHLLPRNDLIKCYNLAQKIFPISCDIKSITSQMLQQESIKELKSFIYTFDPPKTIRALLQERKNIQKEGLCKMGHNICICLICSWKGCFDCSACHIHTNKIHNNDSLFFNFITGGFYHIYNGIIINIRSLYINDLGVSWKPKYEDDNFYFEIDMYQKMIQALKSGNLIQMIRSNFEYLKLPENSNWAL